MNSAISSSYPSEVETEDEVYGLPIAGLTLDEPLNSLNPEKRPPPKPFPFLMLPSELRVKVYEYYFSDVENVLDLGPENYKRYHKLLGLMRVCRLVSHEATHYFYSSRTFRLFPTHPAKVKTKKPLLARLKPRQRQCITTLELRLDPGWSSPPRSWVINDALGLKDCFSVTKLNVFVQCDPSDGIFKGFRRPDGFYENFSRQLLDGVIGILPGLHALEFDAWSAVKKTGAMMHSLLDVAVESKLLIRWGPVRGWTDAMDEDEEVRTPVNMLDGVPHGGSSFAPSNILVVA